MSTAGSRREDWNKADARVLGQILVAQNILFALPDVNRIGEFYAETLISIPGIKACRVCLGDRSVQSSEMENGVCTDCQTLRRTEGRGEAFILPTSDFKCNLAGRPGMCSIPVDSYQHHFGFFTLHINDDAEFEIYHPFISNLANYLALILENRLQQDLLQKAHNELERKVEERTRDLTVANESLSESRLAAVSMMQAAIEAQHRAEQVNVDLQWEITERKQAEERLRLLDFALDHVREAAFLTDENALFRFVNEEACRILGYTRTKLLELGVHDVDPDFPMDRWFSHWYDLKTNGSLIFESRHRKRDGSNFPVEITANYFEYGGRGYNLALVRDITERRRAEQERQANLRFFEHMDRVNRAIQGTNDLERMMRDGLNMVLSIFDCDRAWLFYPCDPDAPTFRVPMEITKPEYPGAATMNVDLPMPCDMAQNLREALESVGPVTYVAGTERPINKVSADQFGVKSMMMAALYPKSDKPWVFGLHQCSHPRVWTQEEERLFQEIGRRLEDGLRAMLAYRNLRDNIAKLEEAQRIGHIGYWDRDIAGNKVILADEACRIFGISPQQSGVSLEQWHERWRALIHPEDRQRVSQAAVEALASGPRYNVEYRIVRPDGEVRHIHSEANVTRDESGHAIRMLGMMQDITERRLAEEEVKRANRQWELTFNAISDMVMVLDGNHRIVRANKAAAAVLGKTEEELVGKFCFELVHEEKKPPSFCPHSLLLADGRPHSVEVPDSRHGRSFDIRVSPVLNETGSVIGAVHIVRDITEQKSLQKQLLQAQKMESIGTLAGGIAHDFNNLLQIMIGYSDMLLFRKKPGEPEYDGLHAIRQAGRDGAELAKRILAFSRRLEPDARPVNLNNEIVRVQRMLERTIPKMTRIEILLADNLMTVSADPTQIEQILLNLAVNAQHAMPDGGRLTLETANVTLGEDYSRSHLDVEPGEYVLLTVSDTGHGMDKEVMEHIFEPFYTTKGPGEGTGLGLAMVFGIVKSHKGHITCYSEPGTGTAFKIYLPAIFQEIERNVAATQQMPGFGTETILLVEDEKSIRKLGEQMLRTAGYTVLTATNGIEALEVYCTHQDRIALVLLDLMMPEMGGKRCLEELLKINPRVRVVIASGYSPNGPTRAALALGAKGFVNKPFEVKSMLHVVRRTLDECCSSEARDQSLEGCSPQAHEDNGPALPDINPPTEGPTTDDTSSATESPLRLRILAIDDRRPYLRMLQVALSQLGHTAITAATGKEGLRMFQETPVDLVICDLGLPDLDGWEVGRRIKQFCREGVAPKTPFIILTGRTDVEDSPTEERRRMADCGVDAILGKPIDVPEVLQVAEKLLKERSSRGF